MTMNPGHSLMMSALQNEYFAPAVQYVPAGLAQPVQASLPYNGQLGFDLCVFTVIMVALWARYFYVPKWARILRRDRRGVTSIEYALMVALIALVLVAAVARMGDLIE